MCNSTTSCLYCPAYLFDVLFNIKRCIWSAVICVGYQRKEDFRAFPQNYAYFLRQPSHGPKYEPNLKEQIVSLDLLLFYVCKCLPTCMYVLCVCPRPTNHKRAPDTPTPKSHAAVSHLVGAGAGTWPQEEQQTLLTAELPLQPHGSSCDANMKEQYWLLPAGISNPYLYHEWTLWMFLFQHILFIWKILVY